MVATRRKKPVSATPAHLALRVEAVRKRLRRWRCAALLVVNPVDIRYLTGFVGDDSWAIVWARRSNVTVLTDFRFQEQIQREAPHVSVKIRKAGLVICLADLLDRARVQRLALQAGHVTLSLRQMLVKKIGAKRLEAVDDGLLRQRAVKDEQEIKTIRHSLRIQQEAFKRTIATIKPGQTEQEIAAYLDYQMCFLGADGPSFNTIVAVDAYASEPHAIPGRRRVKKGSAILIDWGARFNGYCSDLTRVVALGKMSSKIKEIYQIVYDAQKAAIDAIAPGKSLQEVDSVARGIIDKAGYGEQFGHSLGHGIGLDIHEQPTLSAKSTGLLEPGHVVTVEPGIYLPGIGGVRLEDDCVVTRSGRRVLSDLPSTIGSTII